jgi:hypothetical protein
MATQRQKRWARQRRLSAAAKKTQRTKNRQTRSRKQLIRHVTRRHGGH